MKQPMSLRREVLRPVSPPLHMDVQAPLSLKRRATNHKRHRTVTALKQFPGCLFAVSAGGGRWPSCQLLIRAAAAAGGRGRDGNARFFFPSTTFPV